MANLSKRRLINQLPAVLQSDTLKNFFAATLDNLFQPGQAESISGYVGQKPDYFDPTKDFYLAESTDARTAYQLEPAMISANVGGVVTDMLCYDDLINYLRSQGSAVNNHSRMFEGDYYSWAPPVDLDKLNNYVQYLWLGSLTDAEQEATAITLRAPRLGYSYDGDSSKTYPLPAAIATFAGAGEFPVVLVNGKPVSSNIVNGAAALSTGSLSTGDLIETIRYGDLVKLFTGQTTLDFSPFLAWQATVPDYENRILNVPNQYSVGDLVYALDVNGFGSVYLCIEDHTAAADFNSQLAYWQIAVNATLATTGSRVRLVDGIGATVATARRFIFDGVGSSISMSPDYSSDTGGSTPLYTVIDRRSTENSPWTRRNMWVHKSSLDWTGQDFSSRKAQRPIIEFLPNIELFNYGTRRMADVQGVLSNATATIIDNFDVNPFDENVWDEDKVLLSRINGQVFGKLHDDDTTVVGSVVVDNGYVLQPNDRLFVNQSASQEPQLNNLVYTVLSNPDTPLPSGATADVIELGVVGEPVRGDIFRVASGEVSVFADPVEYWFNGIEWVLAQTGATVPLFMLYDSEQNMLSDTNIYAESDFAGSPLFSYQVGTGTPDPVLGFPINYDSYSQPIFEIDAVVNRVTYLGGTIGGFYYHHFLDPNGPGTFSNDWFPVANASTQALVNGVYDVPLNLQANPGNLEITTISRNQWFDHFSEIMEQQEGFTGHPYSVNNWRDTAKILGHGDKIVQHRSPLLKTMLISANANYDLPNSLRYAEQEYTRYRNKFVFTISELRSAGTLLDTDTPAAWVDAILNQLRLNKTSSFPFSGSTMAGGQYFIPPTPASMGLTAVSVPGLVLDATFANPVSMIRGHDGTLVPAFGDMRDAIVVAFEQRIYDNIPATFKTEARPVFDLDHYISGKFYDSGDLGYTRDEINAMLAPFFQRWAQNNRMDFRANNGYDANNPFSWNYSKSLDKDGLPVPGYWRGIYQLYFDTDRPHLAPWEMLGFIDKPAWWQSTYGPAPYTSGNTKLWDDLRDGNIAGGVRTGIDPRYARPTLYNYLPVNEEGDLLDPISAKIIPDAPIYQFASAQWSVGDYAPVESLWRTSSSFRFAQAQVGFLTKPARFVEQGWDTVNQRDDAGQWIFVPTGNRPLDSEIYVHGELGPDGTRVAAVGVQQWISDYMVSRGQDPTIFGAAIRGLQVRLAHKMAGFTTADLRVLADNFGLVPAEDVSIQLYNSPSTAEEVYSGVIIEWTGIGWRVIGYDTRDSIFYTIPGETNGPKGVISLANAPEPTINSWKPNVYYSLGTNVAYDNTVYTAKKGHTSGASFDQQYWTPTGALPPQAPRVTTYQKAQSSTVISVPYGTVFTTYQQVADFLLGYERYLVSRGWTFDSVNSSTQEPLDWSLAVREFLGWAQVNWQPGNFITLSPGAQGIKFSTDHGMVLNVLNPVNGTYGMLDRAGMPIDRRNVVVQRIDGDAVLMSKNNDVYGARVNIGETEHILLFSNTTIFNDIIYAPLFNLRQPRLLLIGNRTTGWTGRLDTPGYVLIDGQIKSNFDKAATDLLTMFDVEKADNTVLRDHARHVIGYDPRDYLSSLVLSEVEQFEFYQGMIHQKGAPGAFDKLLRSDFIEQSRDLQFFEEWAILIDEYGAVQSRDRLAFLFGQSSILRDPQYIQFMQTDANTVVSVPNPAWIELVDDVTTGLDTKWVERPNDTLNAFPQRTSLAVQPTDYPTAGYVRLTEVDHTVFLSTSVLDVYDANTNTTLNTGEVVWVHRNEEIRNMSSAAASNWYLLGTSLGAGHWDGTSNTRTLATSYTTVNADNQIVFRSMPNDAPYITNDEQFTPVPGQTYTATFTVRKVVRETNGVRPYVRPAFDAFLANGVIDGALGAKSGVGYDPSTDLLDTTGWVLNTWYDVKATWTCPASPVYTAARGRLRVNRTYPFDAVTTAYSDAVFEVLGLQVAVDQPIGWDALKVYNMSDDGSTNTVMQVVTNNEDNTLANTTMRVFTLNPHGLTDADRGLFYVIDGQTLSDSELQGCGRIFNVGEGYFDIETTGKHGYDFYTNGLVGPEVRILRSIHFANVDAFTASKTRPGLQDGDFAYVDGPSGQPWNVYQRSSVTELTDDWDPNDGIFQSITYTFWTIVRTQPLRIDGTRIASSLIYDLKTKITTTDLQPEPLMLDHMTVVSPLTGIIPGRAASEIDFMVEYDPARYNNIPFGLASDGTISFAKTGSQTGIWGPNEVGRLWWDLSTVRFLETETDYVVYGLTEPLRYNDEVTYRTKYWGQIAPATSVDVYEWTRSVYTPLEYASLVETDTTGTYTGEVYNPDNPSWVSTEELEAGVITQFNYFWVKNVQIVPNVSFRNMAAQTVSQFITNPMIEDQPWIAPVMPNGVLVGGVSPFVDDTFEVSDDGVASSGTVLQIELTNTTYEGVVHDEWMLLRPADERSLPPPWLWDKLRDSLVGFDDNKVKNPPGLTLPTASAPVNKRPVWYTGPGPNDVPIDE